jgi:putative drug exporter of the RND superfamily
VTRPLYALGRLCVRYRFVVLAAWLVFVVVLASFARSVDQQTSDDLVLPGTDSQRASNTLSADFPTQANGTNPIALQVPKGQKLSDARYKNAVDQVVKAYKNDPAVVKVVSPLGSDGAGQVAKDKSIGFISLTLKDSPSELNVDEAHQIVDVADPAKAAGIKVAAGGYLGQKVSKPSTHVSEVVGIVAAIIILLFTFGSVVAMGLPITTAILGLVSGLAVVTLLGQVVQVPTTAPALATMIGLGVGIDYGLFVVSRHLGQLRGGMEVRESIARSTASSGGAVVFAGSTVIIALLSLALADIPLVRTLGFTSAIVVFIAMVAAITLLPALLGILGTKVHALRLPGLRVHHDARPHGWARWAQSVADHPWPALAVGVVVLLVLASPLRLLHLGQTDVGALPTDTQARQAYDRMSSGFGAGSNGPMLVAVHLSKKATNDQQQLDKLNKKQADQQAKEQQQAKQQTEQLTKQLTQQLTPQIAQQLMAQGVPRQQAQQQAEKQAQQQAAKQAKQQVAAQQSKQQQKQAGKAAKTKEQKRFLKSKASDPRLQQLRTDLQKTPGVKSVTQPLVNKSGSAAVYTLAAKTAPSSRTTEDLVNALRDDVIPKDTKGQGMTADIGGTTAGYIDLAKQISKKLPLVIGIVLALSFVLLTLAFRSLLVPLKAVIMNLLSIGAAFGIVTYAFGHTWSAKLVGLDGTVPVVSFVPLMMFAILFGLSMDYEVFLMTHVRERWQATADAHRAVIEGLAGTARVITSAALIMVSVFCAFLINGDPNIKQFGLGMAAAVAVDATVVRCFLVPAIMSLLGPTAWSLPHWLDRALPHMSIEGDEYFAEREAAAAEEREREEEPISLA